MKQANQCYRLYRFRKLRLKRERIREGLMSMDWVVGRVEQVRCWVQVEWEDGRVVA